MTWTLDLKFNKQLYGGTFIKFVREILLTTKFNMPENNMNMKHC